MRPWEEQEDDEEETSPDGNWKWTQRELKLQLEVVPQTDRHVRLVVFGKTKATTTQTTTGRCRGRGTDG